jgi:DNA-binding NarL/FixJ family response regulator
MSAIRVVLADDHPVVREGLRGMLAAEPDIEVVGEAGSGPEAVALAARLRPDVVLMDLRMPGGDGVEATRQLAGTTVVVLTTYDSDADILRAVEAGAAGYLLKDTPRAVLADSVRAAARGETVLAPAVAGRLLGAMRATAAASSEQLSARETEVLALVARGLTNAEIGRRLYLSEATVKTHLLRASAKLGVSGRTAAVTKAIEIGALPAPGQARLQLARYAPCSGGRTSMSNSLPSGSAIWRHPKPSSSRVAPGSSHLPPSASISAVAMSRSSTIRSRCSRFLPDLASGTC